MADMGTKEAAEKWGSPKERLQNGVERFVIQE